MKYENGKSHNEPDDYDWKLDAKIPRKVKG